MPRFRKGSSTQKEYFDGNHRFEHWYRDNTIYFITARCRDKFPAFESEKAKLIFWDRFEHYAPRHGFNPWIGTLMNNHYHWMRHLLHGAQLGPMMQKIHGSVAKLVNDLLPERRVPFWMDRGNQNYFDGCIRDEQQGRRAWRYTYFQSRRHGIVLDPRDYPHTRVYLQLEDAIQEALEMRAFMTGVRYPRYER